MSVVLPLFHPTSVIFINDNLETLKLIIKTLNLTHKPHRTFDEPAQGLEYININTYRQQLVNRLVTPGEEEEFCYQDEAMARELFKAERYEQISVLVVDYDMPGMTGLEVCAQITNPHIKKILLTGAADERLALDAFNQGLIYQYIRKQDPHFIEHLQHALTAAQLQYFQEIAELPVRMLASRYDSTALIDPAFKTYFDHLVNKHHIVEYYLVESMGSFIMIDEQHNIYCLMTLDDGMVEMYLHSKSAETFSAEQTKAVEQKKIIPCYYDPFNDYGFENSQLAQYLHKPTIVQGIECPYYCGFGQGFFPVDRHKIILR